MQSLLSEFLTSFVFTYFIVFVRFGTALVIMPGIGDTFVSSQIRLLFALALSLVVTPALQAHIPAPPSSTFLLSLYIIKEALIGFFIGLVGRIMISALSIGGMMISMQSGLASALVFNPSTSSQGSLIGAFLSVAGVTLIFATDLHHLLILTVFESYTLFSFGDLTNIGSMADAVARLLSDSFRIGVQFSVPFIIVSLMLYAALGILARLMPQLQVFFIALPLQIFLGILILFITLGVAMSYWLGAFETTLIGMLAQ